MSTTAAVAAMQLIALIVIGVNVGIIYEAWRLTKMHLFMFGMCMQATVGALVLALFGI